MDLQKFISETLSDIIRGIHKARVDNYELSALIPGSLNGVPQDIQTKVSFDIAVTVEGESKKGTTNELNGHAKIKVLGVGVGVDSKNRFNWGRSETNTHVSRVSFEVPIILNANHRNDPGMLDERDFVNKFLRNGS